VAVRNRLYAVGGRFELGLNVGFTVLTRLTDHYNFNLSLAHNFNDWLALELRGGYAYSRHTDLADQIQADFAANSSISKASDLADLWEMTGNGALGLRFQPIYGKINLVSDLPIHFQLYVWAGGGAAMLKRESLVLCATGQGSRDCSGYLKQNSIAPVVSAALGFRFFLGSNHHSLKLEIRDWSYFDSYYVKVDRAAASAEDPTAGGELRRNAGITNLAQIDLGYSFIF
jgi:outer membrane beta-barrel protein